MGLKHMAGTRLKKPVYQQKLQGALAMAMNPSRKRIRFSKHKQIEIRLRDFIDDVNKAFAITKLCLSQSIIKAQVEIIAEEVGVPFSFSGGWWYRFCQRWGFNRVKLHGSAGDVNAAEAATNMDVFKQKIAASGVRLDNVFNMDETGLCYR
jgi:hypothetical protein